MRTPFPLLSLSLLLMAAPAAAQEWRPFEVTIPEATVNEGLDQQQREAARARRTAPPQPPAESLGESLRRLKDAMVDVTGARVSFGRNRIGLEARVRIFSIFKFTWLTVRFLLEPKVVSPNVVELQAVSGSERWDHRREWETLSRSSLSSNLSDLAETVAEGVGEMGTVRYQRGRDGARHTIRIDLSAWARTEGVRLEGIAVASDQITLSGKTTKRTIDLTIGAGELGRSLRATRNEVPELRQLLGPMARLDVGHDNPGLLTLHSEADLPWLPTTKYRAVFSVKREGPLRLKLTLEKVYIGGDRMSRFFNSNRVGRRIKAWVMKKVYAGLDALQDQLAKDFAAGKADVKVWHRASAPHVRYIDLRPGKAGDITIRPGFSIDRVRVVPGAIQVRARLNDAPTASTATATPAPTARTRGISGALGD